MILVAEDESRLLRSLVRVLNGLYAYDYSETGTYDDLIHPNSEENRDMGDDYISEKSALVENLRALHINEGDVILVHSSMKAIHTLLSPEDVIDALQIAVGKDGTLLIPALTYDNVTEDSPVFDSKTTAPCIGLIPSRFMNMPGVVRSEHPTHSVFARGRLANELTRDHAIDRTPVGANSPFIKLMQYGGKLIFIGEILESCTFMHGVEERFGTDYILKEEPTIYTVNGKECVHYSHDYYGWGAEFGRIKSILQGDELLTGKFGEVVCYVVDPNALMDKATKALEMDPHYFVTDITCYI